MKHPEKLRRASIFRETTEDVYAGIEFWQGTPEVKKVIDFLNNDMLKGRQEEDSRGIRASGSKPISITGTKRLVRHAIKYARRNYWTQSADLVHKGNIQKFTEGAFREVGVTR